jgi:hypothetical protein
MIRPRINAVIIVTGKAIRQLARKIQINFLATRKIKFRQTHTIHYTKRQYNLKEIKNLKEQIT